MPLAIAVFPAGARRLQLPQVITPTQSPAKGGHRRPVGRACCVYAGGLAGARNGPRNCFDLTAITHSIRRRMLAKAGRAKARAATTSSPWRTKPTARRSEPCPRRLHRQPCRIFTSRPSRTSPTHPHRRANHVPGRRGKGGGTGPVPPPVDHACSASNSW
ncbi:hypothetical protein [Lysobacter gummosus]|uniref:hypothetical protein n=1 Tax=Lysobacter gummosus TaxID=262324 RepID=UPI0036438FEE